MTNFEQLSKLTWLAREFDNRAMALAKPFAQILEKVNENKKEDSSTVADDGSARFSRLMDAIRSLSSNRGLLEQTFLTVFLTTVPDGEFTENSLKNTTLRTDAHDVLLKEALRLLQVKYTSYLRTTKVNVLHGYAAAAMMAEVIWWWVIHVLVDLDHADAGNLKFPPLEAFGTWSVNGVFALHTKVRVEYEKDALVRPLMDAAVENCSAWKQPFENYEEGRNVEIAVDAIVRNERGLAIAFGESPNAMRQALWVLFDPKSRRELYGRLDEEAAANRALSEQKAE